MSIRTPACDCCPGCECHIISRDEIIDRSRRSAEALGHTLESARAAYLGGALGLEWDGAFLLPLLAPGDPLSLAVDATRDER